MDVKYRPEPWQNMGDGMNRITKDALMKLREANESLKRIDGRIRDLDSDGSIHFNPKDQSQKIGELLDSYTTLQKYCGEAGRLVSEHIDKPFLVEMDKFAQTYLYQNKLRLDNLVHKKFHQNDCIILHFALNYYFSKMK